MWEIRAGPSWVIEVYQIDMGESRVYYYKCTYLRLHIESRIPVGVSLALKVNHEQKKKVE